MDEDFIVMRDEEVHKQRLVGVFLQGHCRLVRRHRGAKESGTEDNAQIVGGHFVLVVFGNPIGINGRCVKFNTKKKGSCSQNVTKIADGSPKISLY